MKRFAIILAVLALAGSADAAMLLQSTATTVTMGPFIDEDDGKTQETVLGITQTDVRLSKQGLDFSAKSAATTATHAGSGWYRVSLSTADTDTLGCLIVMVHESGALPVWREFHVVTANIYNSLVSGTDALDVEVASMAAGVITSTVMATNSIGADEIATDAIGAAEIAADAIGASELATGAADEIADEVWDEASADHVAAGTTGELLQDIDDEVDVIHDTVIGIALTGAATGVVADSATISTGSQTATYANTYSSDEVYHQVAESGNEIDFFYQFDIGTDGTPVAATAKGRVDEGSVPSGGDTVYMYAYNWATSSWDTIGSGDGIANSTAADDISLNAKLLVSHVGTAGNDGLVRIRFAGVTLEASTEVFIDQVFVEYANVLNYVGINAEVDTALSDYDGPTKAEMDTAHALLATSATLATVSGNVDAILLDTGELQTNQGAWATAVGFSTHAPAAVWTATTRTLTSGGAPSANLADYKATGFSTHAAADVWTATTRTLTSGAAPSAATISDAVWDETLADHLGAGSTGLQLNAAASAGDPWSTALPGAYADGTAGYVIGHEAATSATQQVILRLIQSH